VASAYQGWGIGLKWASPTMMRWNMLPIPDDPKSEASKWVMRWNALGSLYFFIKHVLGRDMLSPVLHQPILARFEPVRPRVLFEMPRDHLKTTMITEGRSIWRVLPVTPADEAAFRDLGYDDEFIAYMKQVHNPARRIAIVTNTADNAIKLGKRFDYHFQDNAIFQRCFSDILPSSKQWWNDETKLIGGTAHGPNGEGTFDFLGVGGALQSRHYVDMIEDDCVGKDELESALMMEKVIAYHKLLIGALLSVKKAEITVVNNRWSPTDLSSFIRKLNDKVPESRKYVIEHHSALGGCCPEHPTGVPIYPEEFSLEDFAEIREVQGPYFFSHQYLNLPVAPEECIFKPEWLRFWHPVKSPISDRHWLGHELAEGEKMADINPYTLIKSMVIDPNHAEERGRSRHAVVVTGLDPETDRIYLLDLWAKSSSYDDLVTAIFKLAKLWNLKECWVENIAGQRLLRYPIEYRQKVDKYNLSVRYDLKTSRGENAKRDRIESLEPLFRNHQIWVNRQDHSDFLAEYYGYPGFPTKDILDALGYSLQTWNTIHAKRVLDIVRAKRDRWAARKTRTGY
jgi:hypothetical protein